MSIMATKVHFNIGCGKDKIPDAINIDSDPSVSPDICDRVPDCLGLTTKCSVDEITANHLLEHLSFDEEAWFFKECYRVLLPGGKLVIMVPDLEWACKTFLDAEENPYEFYKLGSEDHFFGGGYLTTNRWSFLMTVLFGHQDGEGQCHLNGYTEGKLMSIARLMKMEVTITPYWRNQTRCLKAIFIK